MIDDVEYRKKYEAGDMTEREELIYLKEENKKLREALKKIKSYGHPDLQYGWIQRWQIEIAELAKKALNR